MKSIRSTRRSEARVFVLALGLLIAIGIVYPEFCYYRDLLHLPQDTVLRTAVFLAILAKSLVALAVALVPSLLLARWGRPRTAMGISIVWGLGVLVFLASDLEVRAVSGNTLLTYAANLVEPNALHWAGPGVRFGSAIWSAAARVELIFISALIGASILRRTHLAAVLAAAWFLLLLAGPVVQRAVTLRYQSADPRSVSMIFDHLDDLLPWTVGAGPRVESSWALDAVALFDPYRDQLWPASERGEVPELHATQKPNVILLVAESLRADVFSPEVMPRMFALSREGLRGDFHHAGSNASHYGLFALCYGRSPLNYFQALQEGAPPPLATWFQAMGYTTYYHTGSMVAWQEMERFLGPQYFQVSTFTQGENWRRDIAMLDSVRKVLATDPDQPKLLIVFLMSTHFNYSYPPEGGWELFQPSLVAEDLNAELADQHDALLNHYRNSAHYLDTLLGEFIEEIDLDRNIVLLTGDHGESLYDDGTLAHASRLSSIQTRVPLMMVGAGVPVRILERPTTHEDLLPTLLTLVGASVPQDVALFGEDLSSPATRPPYVPLVYARSRGYQRDQLALVGHSNRFVLSISRSRDELRFDGTLDEFGLPSHLPLSDSEQLVLREWFTDYLRRSSTGEDRGLESRADQNPSADAESMPPQYGSRG